MIINLIFNFTNFCIVICLFAKLLTSGNLFSTTVNAELVAKPVILGILFSISAGFAFKSDCLAKSLVSRIFLSASLIFFSLSDLSVSYAVFETNPVVSMLFALETNLLYSFFLTTSFFTTLLSLAKSLRVGVNLSISSLSTSVFRLEKFDFSAKQVTSICDIFLKSVYVA